MNTKPCSSCDRVLPTSEFTKDRRAPTGLKYYCKACQAEMTKNREKQPRSTKEKRCPKCTQVLAASSFATSATHRDGLKAWCRACDSLHKIEELYKIEPERYSKMIAGGCLICGSLERLHVDHDHTCCPGRKSCGRCVRGILCESHNLGLGYFRDDPAALLVAVEYLRSTGLYAEESQSHSDTQ